MKKTHQKELDRGDKKDYQDKNHIPETINDYELHSLPTPKEGPYILDEGFDVIYGYDKLLNLVKATQEQFRKEILKIIPVEDLDKIESGIKEYVYPCKEAFKMKDILKASILNCYGKDLLTQNYDLENDDIKTIIKPYYFENLEKLFEPDFVLIPNESIKTYRQCAQKHSMDCISNWLKILKDDKIEKKFEDLEFYRGINNFKYFKTEIKKNKELKNERRNIDEAFPKKKGIIKLITEIESKYPLDYLSIFSGIGKEGFPFFERQLLSSYSLNSRVSEKFMVAIGKIGKNNTNKNTSTRRSIISVNISIVIRNMFSSFIVCDKFIEGQYEFLTLPSVKDLFIFEEVNDMINAEFFISDDKEFPNRLQRMPVR